MCSEGDTWGPIKATRRPLRARPVLPRRKQFYRWLSEVFAHWAETADE